MTGLLLPAGGPRSTAARSKLIAALPPEIERATEAAIERRDAQLERVSGGVVERLRRLGSGILSQVSSSLGSALPTRLRQLTESLRGLTEQWGREVTSTVQAAQRDAVAIGQELVDARLIAASVDVLAPEVSVELLSVLQDYSADLIKGLGDDLLKRVTSTLRQGVLGQMSTEQMIQDIARLLPSDLGHGSLDARAEAIVITEVGRVHSMAGWLRLQQALAARPDLMKEWRHSGLQRNPRSGHVAINGQRRPVAEPFRVAPVVGGRSELMQYPRHAIASAANSVRCKCVALPYLPEWEDV